MKSKITKRVVAMLLVLCMTVTTFALNTLADDSTNINAASTDKVDACQTVVQGYSAAQAKKFIDGDNTYPEFSGYLFAGWYTDAACTTLLNGATPTATTYALFVPKHVLSVKAQVSSNLLDKNSDNDEKASLRFITTVDSLRYKQVGFEISYKKGDKIYRAIKASSKVYEQLYECGSDEDIWEKTPQGTFCGLSQYFKICTLKDFTYETFYETEFTVKPFWVTADGDTVYGVTATKSMKEGYLKQSVQLDINECKNGTVTADKTQYYAGDLVTLTATPGEGYNLTKLNVTKDGTPVDVGTITFAGGEYSFVAEIGSYVVDAEFTRKIFVDDYTGWDLTKQYDGVVSVVPEGQTEKLDFYDSYEDIDLSLRVKDDPTNNSNSGEGEAARTTVELAFSNKKVLPLSICTDSNGKFIIQNKNNDRASEGYELIGKAWNPLHNLTDAQVKLFQSADGIGLRVVRKGTEIVLYLENGIDGKLVQVYSEDWSSAIEATTAMNVRICRDKDYGVNIEMPFSVSGKVEKSGVDIKASDYGSLKTTNQKIFIGDTVVIKEDTLTNANYYLAGLRVDGEEVDLELDGTYSFVASKATHTVEGIYKKAIFNKDNTGWNLIRQNQSTTDDGVTSGVISIVPDEQERLDFIDSYTDIDLILRVKDDQTVSSQARTTVEFAFSNGATFYPSICESEYFQVKPCSWNSNSWSGPKSKLESEEIEAYKTTGIDLRIVRNGTKFTIYIVDVTDSSMREVFAEDYSAYISADTTATVTISHDDDKGVNIEMPFSVCSTVRKSTIQFVESEYGTLTTDKTEYSIRDAVIISEETLDDAGYYLAGLRVDGEEVDLELDGTYSFVASKATHTVEGIYKKAIFSKDNSGWNLIRQNQSTTDDGVTTGVISVVPDGPERLDFIDSYTDMDLILRVKDDQTVSSAARTTVEFAFENGATFYPSICESEYFQVKPCSWNSNSWSGPKSKLESEEIEAYKTTGIDLRIVRNGTKFTIYIVDVTDSSMREVFAEDYSAYISADTTATVTISHDDDKGVNIEMPFSVCNTVRKSTIEFVSSEYGTLTADKTEYSVGDTIVIKEDTLTNNAYYLSGLKVDDKEVELGLDGTYSFIATESTHTVEGVYKKAIFSKDNTGWNLIRQNQNTTDDGVTTGVISVVPDGPERLDFIDSYTDMDLILRVKDDQTVSSAARTTVEFAFENGATFYPSICESEYFQVKPCSWNNNSWSGPKSKLESEEIEAYKTTGIDLRIVRKGTKFTIYIVDVTDGSSMREVFAEDYSAYISADTTATVTISHDDDKGVNIEMPFKLRKDVQYTTISLIKSEYGSLTTQRVENLIGDTIVIQNNDLKVSDYYLSGLKVDGEEVALKSDGTCSFVATSSMHTVEGIWEKGIFGEHSGWNLISMEQNGAEGVTTGVISLVPDNDAQGCYESLSFKDSYTDMDLTVRVKDDQTVSSQARTTVEFAFSNGATFYPSICEDKYFQVKPCSWNNNGWSGPKLELETGEIEAYKTTGIDFRIVRNGTKFTIYIVDVTDSSMREVFAEDYSVHISAHTEAVVTISHNDDKGVEIQMPFTLKLPQEVTTYQGALGDGETVSTFNSSLFYRNDKKTDIADPFVLDNTARDGYYYLYGTEGRFCCYRSTNMMDWEKVGNTLSKTTDDETGKNLCASNLWAPEVVYDEDAKKYYMFFSATPEEDDNATIANLFGEAGYMMMVASSNYPDKGFEVMKLRDIGTAGTYTQYYADYALFNPNDQQLVTLATTYKIKNSAIGYVNAIDAHPFIDSDNKKYLFWCSNGETNNAVFGVQMTDWVTPNWDTLQILTCSNYYTVVDWKEAILDGEDVEKVSYEENVVNEAPSVVKHNGKYYLTFSVNGCENESYQVATAVSDSVLGTYRKLTEKEGGILLSSETAGNHQLSGTGHNGFVTIGEQTYIIYHRHNDVVAAGYARNHAIDEIKWITVKDINGNDLDVMYVNGPTTTVQSKVEKYSEYVNVADEATVTGAENATYLTDGLLSVCKNGNETFTSYINEATIAKTTTFTFNYDSAKAVRAIMVYNSKDEATCFRNISNVTLVCEEDGKEVIRYIDGMKFSSEYFDESNGSVSYVTPGACAYAEFNELNVKSIRITVEVPEGQETVGISEVKILGK